MTLAASVNIARERCAGSAIRAKSDGGRRSRLVCERLAATDAVITAAEINAVTKPAARIMGSPAACQEPTRYGRQRFRTEQAARYGQQAPMCRQISHPAAMMTGLSRLRPAPRPAPVALLRCAHLCA